MASDRSSHALAILGPKLYDKIPQTKVLLVGAGGIGCELLKNLVLTGFGRITLVDLDTIDLSNLNRQFLFRKKNVKQSKAHVAARTAGAFNPSVQILPIHANIKESQFDIDWFQQYDIVFNALDNLDARRYVNRMCMAARIPLVESGTAGYLGQVQPLLKDVSECFDCVMKPTPKTFPVCTIRSTPSQPIHCIVWAKSYLCGQLFGEGEDAIGELDEAENQGENSQEIAALRKEALEFNKVRSILRSPNAEGGKAAKIVFQKVFHSDILNLLSMHDMWRTRSPPIPLDFDSILEGSFVMPPKSLTTVRPIKNLPKQARTNGLEMPGGDNNGLLSTGSSGDDAGFKDQRKLSLRDSLELFVSSIKRLANRLGAGEESISFDKDDDDTLDFVTASSNLRSHAYGIEGKTRWEVKEMAGNIIPAIATTNAIISGIVVLQALHLLRKSYDTLRNVHIQLKPAVPLSAITLSSPNPCCGVCRDSYVTLRCDPTCSTLGDVVRGILGVGEEDEEAMQHISVYEEKRILSDPDWEDNYERTLESLNVTQGKFLSIVDENGEFETITIAIASLPPNHLDTSASFILPPSLPKPSPRAKPPAPPPVTPPSLKRPAAEYDDGTIDLEPTPKRPKSNSRKADKDISSPSKRRRLEADGLVLMEGKEDTLDDEIIEID